MIPFIALGSALGGVARYLVALAFARPTPVPVATLLVNVTGSLILGFVARYTALTAAWSPEAKAFLTIGFCGGYTTFSTFSIEVAALIEQGEFGRAAVYGGLSGILAVSAVFGGFALAGWAAAWRAGA